MTERAGERPCYALVTEWVLAAPAERIFDVLAHPEAWPSWWPYLESVTPVVRGGADGIGAVWRYTWSSRLPYRLTFDMTTTGVRRPDAIEGTAAGELCGTGRWRLSSEGDATRVRYEWRVRTGKRWMNALAPLLAPAFEWNHDQVMAAGGRGLARHLGVTLRGYARLSGQESRCTTC
jgi:hypothetical protein